MKNLRYSGDCGHITIFDCPATDDVMYAYNPDGLWTSKHQLLVADKAKGYQLEDFKEFGRHFNIRPISKVSKIINKVGRCVSEWNTYAERAGVDGNKFTQIQNRLRECEIP